MKFYVLTFLIIVLTLGLITTADAKRFGGGKSFGMSRSYSSHSSSSYTAPIKAATPAKSSISKWLGPIAGFALGGLIASLFMGHGLGTGLLSWLVIGGILLFIWSLFKKAQTHSTKFQSYHTEPASQFNDLSHKGLPLKVISNHPTNEISFDKEAFLRHAKTVFIRLQAAYDSKNLSDIREFTAPIVFAEIQMQIQERGNAVNVTQVIEINAELLEFDPEVDDLIASVIFSGKIGEDGNMAEPFKEIWHFKQDKISLNWTVIGIQQMTS